jgi:methylmalonyl-CoA mutase
MIAPLPLADGFPVFTEDDWRTSVTKARRRGVDSAADSTATDIELTGPFPRRAGARAIPGRTAGQRWQIIQRVRAPDATGVGQAVADEAAGGANGAEISFAGGLHPLGGQLPVETAKAVAAALAVSLPDRFELRVDTGGSLAVAEAFANLAGARVGRLVFLFDPVGALAVHGHGPTSQADAKAYTEVTAAMLSARGIDGVAVIADGRLWHAGGATEEQELAATLATFVAHLRALQSPGRIEIALAADAEQFRGIAKFRAMRLLLARVAEIAALGSASTRIHGETAWRMLGARDPEMNILRATSAAFAAAVGGANSIAILPFDALAPGSDSHGRRLARNTQTILADEAHIFRVSDPAAGSGAIEALTTGFAQGAWKRFQAIEAAGGIVAAIAGDTLLREIAEVREARIARMAAHDLVMVGVNAYDRDGAIQTPTRTRRAPIRRAETLVFKRLAEPFEERHA